MDKILFCCNSSLYPFKMYNLEKEDIPILKFLLACDNTSHENIIKIIDESLLNEDMEKKLKTTFDKKVINSIEL